MSDDPRPDPPSIEDAHPRAREALTDAFYWDAADPAGPFGNDTALSVWEALQDLRDEDRTASSIPLLAELLGEWEIADEGWDVIDEDEVSALGAEDELGLLVRDEAILALAIGDLMITGRIDPEARRRAVLALRRQALPALLHGYGDRMRAREERVAKMREVLSRKWD